MVLGGKAPGAKNCIGEKKGHGPDPRRVPGYPTTARRLGSKKGDQTCQPDEENTRSPWTREGRGAPLRTLAEPRGTDA